jgi:outer membrane protein
LNRYSQIANAKLHVKDSKYQLQEKKQMLFKTILKTVNEVEAAYEDYNYSLESLKWNEEAFHHTNEKFDVGMIDAIEYRIAKNELLQASSNAANAKFNYLLRMKILEFYMGREFEI